jgi:hypothetical protein
MSNEIEQDVDLNNEEDLDLDLNSEESDDTPEDNKKSEEKPKETPEQKVARLKRQLAREERKLGGDKTERTESKEKATKSGELSDGQVAILRADGIRGVAETALVKEFMDNTGKSLLDVLDNKFFQAELKEMRESKASADAVPKGSKRSTSSSRDKVDYWLAKGELPENTPENQELRREVVNARYKRETSGSKFASSPTGSVTRQSQLRK